MLGILEWLEPQPFKSLGENYTTKFKFIIGHTVSSKDKSKVFKNSSKLLYSPIPERCKP